MSNEDRRFNVSFNSSIQQNMKVKLNKVDSNVDININTSKVETGDTYYDEIIYYDGGGVEGYGD